MFEKIIKNQDKELDRAMKANEKRLSGHSKAILDYLATLDISTNDVLILAQGIVRGIEKVLESRTMPVLKEHKAKKFKDFYEESEAKEKESENNPEV